MGVKHNFVSGKSDSADTSLVNPSDWNEDHVIDGNVSPDTNNAYSLGISGTAFSDLYLGDGGLIDWGNNGAEFYHSAATDSLIIIADPNAVSANTTLDLGTDGSSRVRVTSTEFHSVTNDQIALGTSSLGWSDLYLADGGVVDWGNGGATITHIAASDSLTISLDAADALASSALQVNLDGLQVFRLNGYYDTGFKLRGGAWGALDIDCPDDGTGGPFVRIRHDSTTPADNDIVALIGAYGKDSANNYFRYLRIGSQALDVTNGTEDGLAILNVGSAGTQDDYGFYIAGDKSRGMGSNNSFEMVSDAAYDGLVIRSDSAGTGQATLTLEADSASPAAGDNFGYLSMYGRDSLANNEYYGQVKWRLLSPTSGSEASLAQITNACNDGEGHISMSFGVRGGQETMTTPGSATNDGITFYNAGTSYPDTTWCSYQTGTGGFYFNLYHDKSTPSTETWQGFTHHANSSTGARRSQLSIQSNMTDATNGADMSAVYISARGNGNEAPLFGLYGLENGGEYGGSSAELQFKNLTNAPRFAISMTNGGVTGPIISIDHDSSSEADDDTIGTFEFRGNDSLNNATVYGEIDVVSTDVTSATEDGRLTIGVARAGTEKDPKIVLDGEELAGDFGNSALAFVFTSSYPGVSFSTSDSGTGGPVISIGQDSASPADNDYIGEVAFYGRDSAAARTTYSQFYAQSLDVTNGTEDGGLMFRCFSDGSLSGGIRMQMVGEQQSVVARNDINWFVDCSDVTAYPGAVFYTTNAGTGGPQLFVHHDSASPAAGDLPGGLYFSGRDSAANNEVYAGAYCYTQDVTSGTEDADWTFYQLTAGSGTNNWIVGGASGFYWQAATGGSKGVGTINAKAVYDDNTLLTCYVDEAVHTGMVDQTRWDDFTLADEEDDFIPSRSGWKRDRNGTAQVHWGAKKFAERLGTEYDPTKFAKQKKHLRDKKHLTPYPNPEKYSEENRPSIGGWVQRGIEMDELLFQYVVELEERVAALES